MIQLREHIKMYSIAGSEYKDLFERPQVDEKKRKSKKKLGGSRLSPPFTLDFCCCIPSRQIGPNSQTIMMRFTMHAAPLFSRSPAGPREGLKIRGGE